MTADKVPTDQATRERIIRDLDTSFAVEAGAGTGKTTLLTARIVEAVRTGRAALPEIVAITFTERAANELKVRLRSEFEAKLAETAGTDDTVAGRFERALAALDAAHVSTIHSFCAEILLERPVEAGVDPGFTVADELETSLLFDEVWDDWLAAELADDRGRLRPAFVAGLTTEKLSEFARFLRDHPDLAPAGGEIDAEAAADRLRTDFVPKARALFEEMKARCPSPDCSCVSRILDAAAAADRMEDAGPADALAAVPALNLSVSRVQRGCGTKAQKERCKRGLNELDAIVAEVREQAAHAVICGVTETLRDLLAAFAAAKRDRARLDFDDLLRKARDLLRDNREVRGYFQRRFKMILVDECQDTDPLQTEIAFFLAEKEPRADDWRHAVIAPGKLLYVGDPKQSIYRFRQADIETYQEAKGLVARHGESATVVQSFRSGTRCIDWINAVFGELIRRPNDGDYQPAYVALDAYREDPGLGATVLQPPEKTEFEHVDEARTAEAAAVASELRAMVTRGDRIYDKETEALRPVTYGDVAVLARTRRSFDAYERAFAGAGIPFRTVSGKAFFARQEVLELRNVLAAIERPHDAVAVVAALRTSLLGLSDDELAAAAPGGFNYVVSDAADAGPYAAGVFALLRRRHAERNARSLPATVQQVLSDTKALELFYLKPGGEQRAANLTKVIDAARSFERTPGATFGGFVRWLGERSLMGDEAESPVNDDTGELVKLLTMHGAKGLEFPVVVLADISYENRTAPVHIADRRAGTFAARLGAKDLNLTTLGFEDALRREKKRAEAERRRLFYVAATRTRDRLILPAFPKQGTGASYLKYLMDLADDTAGSIQTETMVDRAALAAAAPAAFRVALAGPPPEERDAILTERKTWEAERAERLRAAREGGKLLAVASDLAAHEFVVPDGAPPDRSRAQRIGTAVHAVLQRVDLAAPEDVAELAAEVAAENDVADEAGTVGALVRAALDHELVRRAARAERLYREVPVNVQVGGTVLEGFIDLAFEEEGEVHLVDYKTDEVPEAEVESHAEGYRLQMGAYALAAARVFGRRPASASLLFLRPGRAAPVEVDDELMGSVEEHCEHVAREHLRGV
jgi:ATP-dependent helicase/nuclease subunit A